MTERVLSEVVELDLDKCQNVYGVSPCTAGRVDSGTAQAGSSTTLTLRAGASAVDDAYKNMTARLTGGAGSVQERKIGGYVGATKVATMEKRWATNLQLRSEEIDNAYYVLRSGTITANTGVAPDGTLTADKLSGAGAYTGPVFSLTNGLQYVFSVYARPLGGSAQINFGALKAGDAGNFVGSQNCTADVWTRLSIAWTENGLTIGTYFQNVSGVTNVEYWGVQLEQASDLGDYIKTSATAIALPDATTTYDIIDRPNACYNTFATCQDRPNYVKGTQPLVFTGLGAPRNTSQMQRPFISSITRAPTELKIEEGLAIRSSSSVTMVDTTDKDVDLDPYVRDRATPAGSTFWRRLIARNPNYSGRTARIKQTYVDHGVFDIGLRAEYLSLPGTNGNFASTPDSAANSLTGDIDFRVKCSAVDWTDPALSHRFLAKRDSQVAYDFFLEAGGFPALFTGTAGWPVSTAAIPFSDGTTGWVRVTRRVSDARVQFFTSTDGTAWTQLGADRTDSTSGALPDTGDRVEVGSLISGQAVWNGKIYYAEIRNGIDGTVAAKFDPASSAKSGDKAFTSSTGEVWTIHQSGMPKAELIGSPLTERFIIDSIRGPDSAGQVTVILKDPIKLADRAMAPPPTSGKLVLALTTNDLQLTLGAGEGAQYAASGYVRIGDEVISYAANAGDVLSWPDGTYRAQFSTEATAASIGDGVQQCLVYQDQAYSAVIEDLLNRGGIADIDIDLTQLATEDATWLGPGYRVTACITDPEEVSALLKELLDQANALLWWSSIAQKVKFKVFAPQSPGTVAARTLDEVKSFLESSVAVERAEDKRMTFSAIYFGVRNAIANIDEAKSYRIGEVAVDVDAESPNEYGERRPKVRYSRWFGDANVLSMRGFVQRDVARHRDTPQDLSFDLDPKDADLVESDVIDTQSQHLVDAAGAMRTARVFITRRENMGTRVKVKARVTPFDRRYGFIAPDGTPAYPNNNGYACVCSNAGLMNDETDGFLVI